MLKNARQWVGPPQRWQTRGGRAARSGPAQQKTQLEGRGVGADAKGATDSATSWVTHSSRKPATTGSPADCELAADNHRAGEKRRAKQKSASWLQTERASSAFPCPTVNSAPWEVGGQVCPATRRAAEEGRREVTAGAGFGPRGSEA